MQIYDKNRKAWNTTLGFIVILSNLMICLGNQFC